MLSRRLMARASAFPVAFATASLWGVPGCGGSSPTPAEPAPSPAATASAAPAATVAPQSAGSGAPVDAPPADSAGGRMAFHQCDPDKRPDMCMHLYKPVCAEVDNGVRCVTTPCNSTDKKNYPNGCSACADPKVVGHWPVPCEQLGNDAKP